MNVLPTRIGGVVVVDTESFHDRRGTFTRLYCARELSSVIGRRQIVQVNHSRTVAVGAVRGLHFQHPPHADMKLVRCLKGRVLDVAVDLRARSPTFLQWHGEELAAANARMLVLPEGCAHGFQALEEDSEILYLHTDFHVPALDDGVRFDDPRLAIAWPLPATCVSDRDRGLPLLAENFGGLLA